MYKTLIGIAGFSMLLILGHAIAFEDSVYPGTPTRGNYRWEQAPNYERSNTTTQNSAPGASNDSVNPGTPTRGNYIWNVPPNPPFSAPTDSGASTQKETGESVLPQQPSP